MTTDIRNQAEDGFHEIHLSGKQLVFLFMATTIVSIVIFLCGVLVGRGVRSDVGTAVSVTSMPASGVDAAAGEAVDKAAASTLGETNVGAAELSYPDRLGVAPPDENVKSATEVPDTAASGRPSAGSPSATESKPPAAAATKPPAKPATGSPPPPPPAKAASAAANKAEPAPAKGGVPATVGTAGTTKSAPPAAAPPPPASPVKGGYTVQVAAVKQRNEAEAIARRLVSRGYEAYVVEPGVSGARMYRVRVGSYADRGDAEKVVKRLAQEERFKPWITR